jgi:hypothetical protein
MPILTTIWFSWLISLTNQTTLLHDINGASFCRAVESAQVPAAPQGRTGSLRARTCVKAWPQRSEPIRQHQSAPGRQR